MNRRSWLGWVLAVGLGGLAPSGLATPLHEAVRTNGVAAIRAILADSEPGTANRTIRGGITPLHLAGALNLPDAVKALTEAGADPNAATDAGFTPLHWAAGRDAAEAVRLLLDAGAQIARATPGGVTPLHWAAQKNAVNAIRVLLLAGAEADAQTAEGLTPLHLAVAKHADEAAVVLAYQSVSRQMEREDAALAERRRAPPAPPATVQPDDQAAVLAAETTALLPHTAFGKALLVPIGFGEGLRFVWIEPLRIWFGQYEVTNGQFRRFRPKHSSRSFENFSLDAPGQPVVYVSWNDASEFCAWLNANYRDRTPPKHVFRLPSEREWMFAASCGGQRQYPWGDEWPPTHGNFSDLTARRQLSDWRGIGGYDDGFAVSCPVTQSGENEWGLFGLSGNVWEWCADWYDGEKQYKVRHGGSWDFDTQPNLRVSARGFDRPDARYDTIGFRIVLAPRP